MPLRRLGLLAVCYVPLIAGWTAPTPLGARELQRGLEQIVELSGASGAAVRAEIADQPALRARADSDDHPLPRDGKFRIASATKTFTAVVVLQLVQEGKLSLGGTVESQLPGLVSNGRNITIRQLLQHESGLPNYLDSQQFNELAGTSQAFEEHRYDALEPADYLRFALAAPARFEPGARFGYSNTNYVLLGMIIEAVCDTSWAEQIVRRIIAPLSLHGTSVPGQRPQLPAPAIHGFMRFADEDVYVDVTDNAFLIGGDAGIVSTLADLNHFFRALVRGELLSDALLAEMQDTVPIEQPGYPDGRYGLGLQWSPLSCGGGYWHHTGDTFGYTVRTGVVADGSRSIALVVNGALESQAAVEAASQLVDHALCGESTATTSTADCGTDGSCAYALNKRAR